jgi:hypothetical protein
MTVTVTGPVGDYTLNAVGTDASGVAHNFPLTLHIVDFNLTAMVPPSITVNRPNSSVPCELSSYGSRLVRCCCGFVL